MKGLGDDRAKQAICFGGLAVVTSCALYFSGAAMLQNALWAWAVMIEIIVIVGCFLRLRFIMQSLEPQNCDKRDRKEAL